VGRNCCHAGQFDQSIQRVLDGFSLLLNPTVDPLLRSVITAARLAAIIETGQELIWGKNEVAKIADQGQRNTQKRCRLPIR
jgi:hypothetical protein